MKKRNNLNKRQSKRKNRIPEFLLTPNMDSEMEMDFDLDMDSEVEMNSKTEWNSEDDWNSKDEWKSRSEWASADDWDDAEELSEELQPNAIWALLLGGVQKQDITKMEWK